MNIDRLRYFTVLADSGTMREAAGHLHISQPALSKAIKLLESELQVQLLVSSGRRVLITDKGRLIAERAKRILDELGKISDADAATGSNRIRIGSFEVFTTYFMGHFAANYFSDADIELRELTPGYLEEQIVLGNVDIGITYIPIPKPELEFIKVVEIEMGIFGVGKKFNHSEFSNLPFVVPITPIQGSPDKVKGLDGWPDDRIPRYVKYRAELMETALEFCRQGLAVAYLPKFVVELHNKQVRQSLMLNQVAVPSKLKSTKQSVYVVKRKSDLEHPVFRKLASVVRKL